MPWNVAAGTRKTLEDGDLVYYWSIADGIPNKDIVVIFQIDELVEDNNGIHALSMAGTEIQVPLRSRIGGKLNFDCASGGDICLHAKDADDFGEFIPTTMLTKVDETGEIQKAYNHFKTV
jgi:hypothetical protein